jgi:hypothetical protein
MRPLRRNGDEQMEAQRFAAQQSARPMAPEEQQLIDLALVAMQSAALDRDAGRWADAQANEAKARAYAKLWKEYQKGVS